MFLFRNRPMVFRSWEENIHLFNSYWRTLQISGEQNKAHISRNQFWRKLYFSSLCKTILQIYSMRILRLCQAIWGYTENKLQYFSILFYVILGPFGTFITKSTEMLNIFLGSIPYSRSHWKYTKRFNELCFRPLHSIDISGPYYYY